jgi:hypothetical protein
MEGSELAIIFPENSVNLTVAQVNVGVSWKDSVLLLPLLAKENDFFF